MYPQLEYIIPGGVSAEEIARLQGVAEAAFRRGYQQGAFAAAEAAACGRSKRTLLEWAVSALAKWRRQPLGERTPPPAVGAVFQ